MDLTISNSARIILTSYLTYFSSPFQWLPNAWDQGKIFMYMLYMYMLLIQWKIGREYTYVHKILWIHILKKKMQLNLCKTTLWRQYTSHSQCWKVLQLPELENVQCRKTWNMKRRLSCRLNLCKVCIHWIFMPPAWKVRRGHLVFGSSVRLSVRLSVCPSVIPSRLYTKCNI